jgi:hypothetical protein
METTSVIGYRLRDINTGRFINFDGSGYSWISNFGSADPEPISLSDAYKRIGEFLARNPNSQVPEIVKVTRPLTPIERASKELGGLLQDLCSRHGLDLGLTKDQVERQIAKELVDLGAGGHTFVATGIPRR